MAPARRNADRLASAIKRIKVTSTGIFHPGRQHSWHTAAALSAAGALNWYATSIYYDPARFPYSLAERLPGRLGARSKALLNRRASDLIDPASVRHLPAWEWTELALAKFSMRRAAEQVNEIGNTIFQRAVLRLVRREPVPRLWGYDTSALLVFQAMRAQGISCVLDQSIAHMGGLRTRLLAERESFPDLINVADIPTQAQSDRSTAELRAASHVVVGCQYAAMLAVQHGAAPEKVHVCPYGYEEANFPREYSEPPHIGRLPVRFVFVGTVSIRKGFHHLVEVFSRMPPDVAVLTMVGPSSIPDEILRKRLGNIQYRPAIPNSELRKLLTSSHCFVFPSLHEGGGIVLYEAAACGLGIVQSSNCGDGVRSGPLGSNGIVLQDNTVEELRAAIDGIVARPGILRDWSAASWAMREERSWSAYRRRIAGLSPSLV